MDVYGATHTGMVRENNEDSFLIRQLHDGYLLAVADGMGGANAGELASAIAIQSLDETILAQVGADLTLLPLAVENANREIGSAAAADKEKEGMGSTLVTAIVRGEIITIAHVGDSRVYLLSGAKLRQLTTDHSYVQQLVDMGIISAEQARTHPKRNLITRALGVDESVLADTAQLTWKEGDVLLLCSDGLDSVTDEELEEVLKRQDTARQKVELLIHLANSRGGKDNVTIIVAQK